MRRSPSLVSLLMVVRSQETKWRGHLLRPHRPAYKPHAWHSKIGSWIGKGYDDTIEKSWVSRIQRKTFFFFLQQIRRLAGVHSFSCSFISCTFKKLQRKTSTRHVLHCEAEPLSLGVPFACGRPPASIWTWTRFLGELGTWRDVKDTA